MAQAVSSATLNGMPSRFRITPDRAVLLGLLLAAAVYCQDLRYDFIMDDVALILLNSTIASWHNWKILFLTHIFYFKDSGIRIQALHYRPVFTLWLMLNRQLFGLILPWWHLTSLLLHIVVSVLVYELGLELLKERWTAALAALLFAFHPVHAESVAYVSVSSDLLAALFLLIAMLSYIRFRKQGSVGYLVASVFAAAAAMLSKETAAMFPWMLLAYELLGGSHSIPDRGWKRFVWTLPFFGVVMAYSVIRTSLFGHNLWLSSGGTNLAAVLDIPLVLVLYFRNLLAPFQLSFYYPVEWISSWSLLSACGFVLLVVTAVLLWKRVGDRQTIRLQLLWLAILLIPPIMAIFTFVSGDSVHDRHLYLASIPFCLIVATLLMHSRLSPKLIFTSGLCISGVLLVVTALHVPSFSDEITLSRRAVEIAPHNVIARGYYASALWNYGRHDEAFQQLHLMTELAPQLPFGYEAYAAALAEVGRDQEAAAQYQKALEVIPGPTPFRGIVLYHLGMIEIRNSQALQAVDHLRAAVQIDPQNSNYHKGLAQALREEGRMNEASEELRLVTDLRQRAL
jgi:protein O-mannosyl-transferase